MTYGREEAELMMTEESDTLVAKRQWGFTWVFGGELRYSSTIRQRRYYTTDRCDVEMTLVSFFRSWLRVTA